MKLHGLMGLAVSVLLATPAMAQVSASSPDALDDALALVGMKRADLGWTPKGWWPRYPADIPYKLRSFDALFAEPLDTITFTRSLAQTAWDGLDPEALNAKPERGSRSLFRTVQRLGIDPKFGGFRGYTANCLAPEMPLDQAIIELYKAAGRTTSPNTFGMVLPYPKIEERLAEKVKELPEGVSPIIGQLVLNIIEAHRWTELAFRNVDPAKRLAVATNYDVGVEMIDAWDYHPEIDDVARMWDEASMWYAAQKCVDALDQARVKLEAWKAEQKEADSSFQIPDFKFEWETPWGWIRILRQSSFSSKMNQGEGSMSFKIQSANQVECDDALLIVSLDGNDWYSGACAAADAKHPISLLLDMGGNDVYSASGASMGAGLTGVGIVLDAAGDDGYKATRYAQGVGQFGLGLLADLGGDDKYEVKYSGQGCGYFGVGLLFDVAGDDNYYIYADGQGLGGVAGVGVLADRSGNDRYVAERKHSITGRSSYHSPNNDVGVSNAQGCGMGRRGDGSDGHSWGGGLGALLDGDGDDYYSSGNWAMGTGYWFGTGVLHDRAGNDEYHGVAYTQGTGAHFCIGVCIDEAGNDKHLAEENSHSSLAWAHDFVIGILLDSAGDDLYSVDSGGLAYSFNRSVAMLLDLGGDDVYKTNLDERKEKKGGLRPGFAAIPNGFRGRDGVSTYFDDTTSIGLFLDVGGNDTYWSVSAAEELLSLNPDDEDAKKQVEAGGAQSIVGNNVHWLDPPDSPNWPDRNFSVGVDRADGQVRFTPRPVRAPSLVRPGSGGGPRR